MRIFDAVTNAGLSSHMDNTIKRATNGILPPRLPLDSLLSLRVARGQDDTFGATSPLTLLAMTSGKELLHRTAICDINFLESEIPERFKLPQARLLKRHIIVVVEIIDSQNFVTTFQKTFCEMKADETC
jgi:hypothetical protein